jgi:hypothetical protein
MMPMSSKGAEPMNNTRTNTVPTTLTAYTVLRHLTASVRAVDTVWAGSPREAVQRSIDVHGPAAHRVLLNGRRVF